MESGELKNRIVIEKNTPVTDSFGEIDDVWTEFAHTFARIRPITGREFFDAQQVNAEQTVRFMIRYITGVTAKMRINWNSRIFNINVVINPSEANEMLVLMATEGSDAG